MRILIITPYFYDENYKQFSKNSTGFGILLKDIAKYLALKAEVYILTNAITKELELDGFTVIKHTIPDIIRAFSFKSFSKGIQRVHTIKEQTCLKDKVRYIYDAIDINYQGKVIKEIKPDIVHFHSVGFKTELGIEYCETIGQKYLLTLHGLVGSLTNVSQDFKKSEKLLLNNAMKKQQIVTVISSGIKRRITNVYRSNNNFENIRVVLNGTEIKDVLKRKDDFIFKKYNIPLEGKIMLCVGNVGKRKNQKQLIRAYMSMEKVYRDNLYILFLGNIDHFIKIKEYIEKYHLEKHIKICGFIERKFLDDYYNCASYNALVSIDEGFGLSFIEGFKHGLPAVSFSDLDAIPDIYDPKVMILADERTDKCLAKAIEKLCHINWDCSYIKDYAKKFSYEKMADNYRSIYRDILNEEKKYVI